MLTLIAVAAAAVGAPAPRMDLPPLKPSDVSFAYHNVVSAGPFYPDAARRMAIPGDVSLICLIGEDGKLPVCEAESERPEGYGFKAAALRMVSHWTVSPKPGGQAIAGRKLALKFHFASADQ